ncbi:MAG: bifunctional precorrin-2 dehydrogenase/sirohydrochlorin ferrochelatase [Firmicutes bacterium]|nr:bifunctional precorrin-2 dehydrogenase/sirohydrochlorin ferrochelatase [Alicyclobacillaceae bacterium]MCL6497078.1 bifunctional precorrin-2 dehydrogenase/sirohydrochlorin ferrochelatase [Bacillota bacterium]
MGYYPVMVDLGRIPVLVVGAGHVAEQKLYALLAAGPRRLDVVAPRATPTIAEWAETGRLRWHARPVRPEDIQQHQLVVAATGDAAVNRDVARWAKAAGAWVNVVDDRRRSTVIGASHFRRGPLVVAVSTSGRAPGLAKLLRQVLEAEFGAEWAAWTREAGRLRRSLPPEDRGPALGRWWRTKQEAGGKS